MENINNNIFNKFTTNYKKTIVEAYALSLASQRGAIEAEDIFWGLTRQKGSLGYEALTKAGIKPKRKNGQLKEIEIKIEDLVQAKDKIFLGSDAEKVIIESTAIAWQYKHNYIGTEHLLYSLIKINDKRVNKILAEHKISPEEIIKNLEVILHSTSKFSEMSKAVHNMKDQTKQKMGRAKYEAESILNFFGTDLTDTNVQKKIDPVIGREKEISRMIQILSRRNKNNPILLGDPGVGKTAIVEGLAKKIMRGEVPDILLGKKIYSLDLTLLVAGTSYRGDFEARIKQVVEEVKADLNIILFIDEIHNIMGAGSSTAGTMDAANILKPALARGEIRCIGATTFEDYKKQIEPDNALARRLQKIEIKEPSPEETKAILKGIKDAYEKHHLVKITDEAIEEAVNLSVRYLPEQFLPDKAIDLIDEVASKIRIEKPINDNVKKLTKLENKLLETSRQKNTLVAEGNYAEALKYKNKEMGLMNKIYKFESLEIKNRLKEEKSEDKERKITRQDIKNLVQEMTKINIPDKNSSREIIRNLKQNLNKKIIGQKQVIEEITNTLKRSTVGLSGEKRPLGSFIFAGPSGVGKTHTAQVLAESLSGDNKSLIRIDMSEFGEKFNASKIIGAPAGYVGYEEGGVLTEKIKRNPYSVILLDEIEKAHPDIFNLFLQVLEDGFLTDNKGKRINFRNTIIIMTTNVGIRKKSAKDNMGFGSTNKEWEQENFKEKLQEFLRPEFLNRIDKILVFNSLNKRDLAKIIKLELDQLRQTLFRQNLKFEWEDKVVNNILDKCREEGQGARIIRDIIREQVENTLADKIININNKQTLLSVRVNKEKIVIK